MADDRSQTGGPVSSFQSQAAEGDIMAKQGDFKKAIDAYTRALNYRPGDKNVLIARSRCYLSLGDAQSALDDAETALREDKDFFKAKYQKAEALYAKGDFEMALVYYHRGHQLRPEVDEFRLGIQKAREAIDNAIGKGTSSADYRHEVQKLNHHHNTQDGSSASTSIDPALHIVAAMNGGTNGNGGADGDDRRISVAEKNSKTLLGELAVDKEFLESLLDDPDFQSHPNSALKQVARDALSYLNSRTEFWHQQKPIYARKKAEVRLKSALPAV